MNQLNLNLPASDWDIEYSQCYGPDEAPAFSSRLALAKGKGTCVGLIISVERPDVEGDVLMPSELLQVSSEDAIEAMTSVIPEYYKGLLGDPVEACTFQGREAAYFVEQRADEDSAVLHAVVMDEVGWCSFVTVRAGHWSSIAYPASILSFLEKYLVL